ncbi:MAG: hypothetical protein ACTTKU_07785 [Eggerthia catenaformis]|uniref:hypothetical protein n=1 Tax=Eggerthia catenaformis TaxID=31973 RepID=UPI0009DBB33F|nr:hypothetical protein [Eggerthia catenaformis]
MITSEVDENKLRFWKELYKKNLNSLKPNRISGRNLNSYFQKKYSAQNYDNVKFKEVVHLNSKENFNEKWDMMKKEFEKIELKEKSSFQNIY